jgi:hypothetical protein
MLDEYTVSAAEEEEEKEEMWLVQTLTILMPGSDWSSDADRRPWMW